MTLIYECYSCFHKIYDTGAGVQPSGLIHVTIFRVETAALRMQTSTLDVFSPTHRRTPCRCRPCNCLAVLSTVPSIVYSGLLTVYSQHSRAADYGHTFRSVDSNCFLYTLRISRLSPEIKFCRFFFRHTNHVSCFVKTFPKWSLF